MQEFLTAHIQWLKAFHIIFVVCWFAGVFYLPRLFVNHVTTDSPAVKERLALMERKLFRFVTPFMVLTLVFGALLFMTNARYYHSAPWMWIKLLMVGILLVNHGLCAYYIRRLRDGLPVPGHVFFRVFNELPVILLFAIVILVKLQP